MKTATLKLVDTYVVIKPRGFLGSTGFAEYLQAIAGARFEPKRKIHVANLDKIPGILRRLRDSGFDAEVEDGLLQKLEAQEAQAWLDLQAARDRLEQMEASFRKKGKSLYPFQRVGVEWLITRKAALLGDEMGTGKTIQTICALPANAPVIVVCPSVVKGVWVRELAAWRSGMHVRVLEGRGSFQAPTAGQVVVTNYDILPPAHLEKCPPQGLDDRGKPIRCPGCAPDLGLAPGTVLVVDEAHAVKNAKTKRGMAVRRIASDCLASGGRSWFLTATPMLNRPEELWTVLDTCDLAREAFGTWSEFVRLFNGKPKTFEKMRGGKRETERRGYAWGTPEIEASERLQRVLLRRMRQDVLRDMPEKTYQQIDVTIDRKALQECDRVVKAVGGVNAMVELLGKDKIPFELISKVRATLARAKIPAMLEIVESYEAQGEPLIVFSAHREPVDLFLERPGWAVITGDTDSAARTRIEEQFQASKLKGIASTIQAGGVGITLTRAAFVLFVDQDWTPALNSQAEDRAYRIGQNRNVQIMSLVASHVLDERLDAILHVKQTLISGSVDAAREKSLGQESPSNG